MDENDEYVSIDRVTGRLSTVGPPVAAEATIVGMRVTELAVPFVASERWLCGTCGEPIWLAKHDPALSRLLGAGARIACLTCASADGLVEDQVLTSRTAIEHVLLALLAPVAEA